MPLAPIKLGLRVTKKMEMRGAIVFWRVEDVSDVVIPRIWRDFPAGFVRNRWHLNPPVLDTLDFVPRTTGQIFYDFRIGITNLAIVVSGNITQMATGDSVTVSIYPRALPNNVIFSQNITTTGEFSVSWTPPKRFEWVVRVRANFNQSQTPIVITSFKIKRGIVEVSGGTPTPVEVSHVFVG